MEHPATGSPEPGTGSGEKGRNRRFFANDFSPTVRPLCASQVGTPEKSRKNNGCYL